MVLGQGLISQPAATSGLPSSSGTKPSSANSQKTTRKFHMQQEIKQLSRINKSQLHVYFFSSEQVCRQVVTGALVAPQVLGLAPHGSEFKQAWVKKILLVGCVPKLYV
jgi:hypothetical protein